jgi:hypothetical protein
MDETDLGISSARQMDLRRSTLSRSTIAVMSPSAPSRTTAPSLRSQRTLYSSAVTRRLPAPVDTMLPWISRPHRLPGGNGAALAVPKWA